jgi:predicted small secreted protein
VLLHLIPNTKSVEEEINMRRIIFAIFMLVLLGTTAACNTVQGLGRDVERVGEETQDAANSVRRRL